MIRRITLLAVMAACAACQSSTMRETTEQADLIVEADYLLTMASEDTARSQAVVIRDGVIIEIADRDSVRQRFRSDNVISGKNRIVLPGLINGHTHASMTLLRGVADDLPLMTWLTRYIFPVELAVVDRDFIRTGTRLACYEMIRGGTTTFVDMYFFPDAVAETVVDCDLRAIVVPSVIEQAAPDAADFRQSLSQAAGFVARWQGRHPRIVPGIGAHSVYTISESALRRIAEQAKSINAPVSIHLAESEDEMEITEAKYGRSPVALLDDLGFLDLTLIAAHVVHGNEKDWQRMAGRSVGAIHNPTSNLKLASGISPIATLIENGVTVGLGTDGAASNNDLDMWEEVRLAALLAKGIGKDPTALPANAALRLATRDGARAIGQGAIIGTLETGKRADLIQVGIDELTQSPVYDPVSHLVYVADEHDVVTTIVDGQILMQDGVVLTIDSAALKRDVAIQRQRIDLVLSDWQPE